METGFTPCSLSANKAKLKFFKGITNLLQDMKKEFSPEDLTAAVYLLGMGTEITRGLTADAFIIFANSIVRAAEESITEEAELKQKGE